MTWQLGLSGLSGSPGLFGVLGIGPPTTPPPLFIPLILLYHLLPFHAPLTLWVLDAPFGRFNEGLSMWDVNGNVSWFCQEIVAPTTLILTLFKTPRLDLSLPSTILAAIYLIHYFHRAIVSPLILSPPRSKQNMIVPIIAGVYNFLNAYCLAIGLAFYPRARPVNGQFWLCILGVIAGFVGNVYHDEILNDLRRPAQKRLVSTSSKSDEKEREKDKKVSNGRYAIPRGGLFRFVSFPNYLSEWFEWTCYALASYPPIFIPTPPFSTLSSAFQSFITPRWYPAYVLHPSWMFIVFLIAAMSPRAIRAHSWYIRTFGDRYPKERKVVIPWVF